MLIVEVKSFSQGLRVLTRFRAYLDEVTDHGNELAASDLAATPE